MNGMNKLFFLVFVSVAKKIYADYKKVLFLILIGVLIVILFIFSSYRKQLFNISESATNVSPVLEKNKILVATIEDEFISKLNQLIIPSRADGKPKFVNEFLGIKILSNKDTVLEKLGVPSSVQFKTFNINDSRVNSTARAIPEFFNGAFVIATEKELSSRQNGFLDFPKWDYEQINSILITIEFDDKRRVKSIQCLSMYGAELDNKWETLRKLCSVNGVTLSEGKSHVLSRLGKPSLVFSNYFGYENLNMYVNFTDDLLTSIEIGKPD
jgi:hypothetical protein